MMPSPEPKAGRSRRGSHLSGLVAITILLGTITACTTSSVSDSAVPANQPGWVVGIGDSYMSGEGGRKADVGSQGGGALSSGAYNRGKSEPGWDVPKTGTSAYDQPDGLVPQIPFCHRSKSALMHIGTGYNSVNLACSGAEVVSAETTVDQTKKWKPGLDLFRDEHLNRQSQIWSLQEFAKTHPVDVVAMSIGGNDFGFGPLVAACVKRFLKTRVSAECSQSNEGKTTMSDSTRDRVKSNIVMAMHNVEDAMFKADPANAQKKWQLVYQIPPTPIPVGRDFTYRQFGYDRQFEGGCGFMDSDANWLTGTVAPRIRETMIDATRQFLTQKRGNYQIKVVDNANEMDWNRLCDISTNRYEMDMNSNGTGQAPPFDTTGRTGEWITDVSLLTQIIDQVTHLDPSAVQEPIHPNYWGQLALRSCLRGAVSSQSTDMILRCSRASEGLNANGEPDLQITSTNP